MLRSFQLLARLPLALLQALGAALGLLVYLLSAGYRRKLLRNLSIAGLPASLRWSCASHAGRMVGELPGSGSGRGRALSGVCDATTST